MFQISIENKPVAIVKEMDGGTIIFEVSRKTEDNALKVADGSTSDVGNTSYDGNVMVQFPLVWIYRYEDDDYLYEIISDIQWDSNYKAYAHTNSKGDIRDFTSDFLNPLITIMSCAVYVAKRSFLPPII